MLYTLNLYSVAYQLYFNKTNKNKKEMATRMVWVLGIPRFFYAKMLCISICFYGFIPLILLIF